MKAKSIIVTTVSHGVHEWSVGDNEGYILDAGVSVSHVRVEEREEEIPHTTGRDGKPATEKRKVALPLLMFPWDEVLKIEFTYDETPIASSTVVN